jgi:DNA-binding XRE family transcriptional regulator
MTPTDFTSRRVQGNTPSNYSLHWNYSLCSSSYMDSAFLQLSSAVRKWLYVVSSILRRWPCLLGTYNFDHRTPEWFSFGALAKYIWLINRKWCHGIDRRKVNENWKIACITCRHFPIPSGELFLRAISSARSRLQIEFTVDASQYWEMCLQEPSFQLMFSIASFVLV